MDKIKVIYIDENEDDRTLFKINFNNDNVELELLHPQSDLEQMIQIIIASNPDAVVSDYRLKEQEPNVTYNGTDLINNLKKIKRKLPCFVLTSYEADAINDTCDVNWIHEKSSITKDAANNKLVFSEKVIQQINVNRNILKKLRKDKDYLLRKSNKTISDERALVNLGNEIEEYLFNDGVLPKELKSYDGLKKLDALIHLTSTLLEKIENRK